MRNRRLLLCAALATVACSHEQPFETPATGSDRPFAPGTPTRLTYNAGGDYRAAWTADGSSFLYSWQYLFEDEHDRCLGQIPSTGGSSTRTICNPNPAAVDSVDLFDTPSPSDDGQLLFLRGSGLPGATAPDQLGIYLASLSDPFAATQVLPLPFSISGGPTYGAISTARWRSGTRVLFVGQSVQYAREYKGAPLDTLVTGLDVVEMEMGGLHPSLAVIPNTDGANSAALSDGRDTLYFTLNNDTRVYRVAFATGQFSIAHDFGALGIARDVTVRGRRLVAVVGGEVEYSDDPVLGPIQPDGGGTLISVDLETGAETVLSGGAVRFFRRPAFAPSGSPVRLVAEGYPPRTNAFRNALVSKVGDLYLFEAP